MRVAALFSGGKDSCYAIHMAQQYGWEVAPLVTMISHAQDSYMFHIPAIHQTALLAEAMGIEQKIKKTHGEKEKELVDLKALLAKLDVDGVVVGALASDYQWSRVQGICQDLGLKSFAPLWRKNQELYMRFLLQAGFEPVIVGVFAEGLDDSWLGRTIDRTALEELIKLSRRNRINVAGEGGEYETIVVDGPNYKKRLRILEVEKIWNGKSGELKITNASLVSKR